MLIAPTPLRAIKHIIPFLRPLFTPRKRFPAFFTDFVWEVGFLTHI